MKKYFCFLFFVLLYLTSCTNSAGDGMNLTDCTEYSVADDSAENYKTDDAPSADELSANLTFKNESPYRIKIFKDSFRENELCVINAGVTKAVYETVSLSDVVYYITYYIKLSNDFAIPYSSNDCFVILPFRKNKIQSLRIYSPDKIDIQDCYMIIENESKKEIIFKHGNSELIPLGNNGEIINQSSIIMSGEKGLYKISSINFDAISKYSLTTINDTAFSLADKILSFIPGSVYKIVLKDESNGGQVCSLMALSSFDKILNDGGLEETTYITVSYQTNFSSKISPKKIQIGTGLTSAQLPFLFRSGYTFAGWFLGNEKISNGYIAMKDLSLSAKWDFTYYTSSTLNQINLSNLEGQYCLHIKGQITEGDLGIIADKIRVSNNSITLDLSKATGLPEIKCNGISEYNSKFSSCYYLKAIILPDTLQRLGNYAFTYCRYLEEIEIPEGTLTVGDLAFYQCNNLSSVTIPKTVTSIGYGAFSYCSKLNSINYRGTKAQWNLISKNNWLENAYIRRVVCSDGVIELN